MGVTVRLGILGGTFDPIHEAHLAVARAARDAMQLHRVIFVPAGQPWMKGETVMASAEDRLQMVRLALSRDPRLCTSSVDIERDGPSYSVDTVADIARDSEPGAKCFLIVGADALPDLPRWRDPERLLQMCTLVAVGRPGSVRPGELPADHPGRAAIYVPGPMMDVSATGVRRRLAQGLPVRGMVPREVEDYIHARRLYSTEGDMHFEPDR